MLSRRVPSQHRGYILGCRLLRRTLFGELEDHSAVLHADVNVQALPLGVAPSLGRQVLGLAGEVFTGRKLTDLPVRPLIPGVGLLAADVEDRDTAP